MISAQEAQKLVKDSYTIPTVKDLNYVDGLIKERAKKGFTYVKIQYQDLESPNSMYEFAQTQGYKVVRYLRKKDLILKWESEQ